MSSYNRKGEKVPWQESEKLLTEDRSVGKTQVGPYLISTVFLVINHGTEEHPMLFETMVFDHTDGVNYADIYCDRYHTEGEAINSHTKIVRMYEAFVILGG